MLCTPYSTLHNNTTYCVHIFHLPQAIGIDSGIICLKYGRKTCLIIVDCHGFTIIIYLHQQCCFFIQALFVLCKRFVWCYAYSNTKYIVMPVFIIVWLFRNFQELSSKRKITKLLNTLKYLILPHILCIVKV